MHITAHRWRPGRRRRRHRRVVPRRAHHVPTPAWPAPACRLVARGAGRAPRR